MRVGAGFKTCPYVFDANRHRGCPSLHSLILSLSKDRCIAAACYSEGLGGSTPLRGRPAPAQGPAR